ncbi:MAG: hypothetical protein OHK0045_23680 [Raineya sp.]
MEISAKKIQEWSNKEISSVAWQRIILKALPQLREKGLELSDLMSPTNLMLSGEAFEIIAAAIEDLYQVAIPSEYVTV